MYVGSSQYGRTGYEQGDDDGLNIMVFGNKSFNNIQSFEMAILSKLDILSGKLATGCKK